MIDRSEPDAPTPPQLVPPAAVADDGGSTAAELPRRIPLHVLCRIFLQIGATAFGGLGPTLALIERELVEKRRVLKAEDVAAAWAATRLLPGSGFIQVVSILGYRLGGWPGSALATVACILPSATAMLLLAIFYDGVALPPVFEHAAQGLTAAVVGILLATTYRFGRATIGGPVSLGVALAAFGSAAGLGIPAAAVVVTAGLIGVPWLSRPGADRGWASRKGGRR
jgi:chromate transporter